MFETLSDGLVNLAVVIINLFPRSPIAGALDAVNAGPVPEWLGMINWFVPVGAMLSVFSVWLTCVLAYYVYQLILRWIKAIE